VINISNFNYQIEDLHEILSRVEEIKNQKLQEAQKQRQEVALKQVNNLN
jgi:hypothetical protein